MKDETVGRPDAASSETPNNAASANDAASRELPSDGPATQRMLRWARTFAEAIAVFPELFAHVETLRASALTPDGKVRDPRLLEQSIRLKADLMVTHMQVKPWLAAVEQTSKGWAAILAEIEAVSPDGAECIQRWFEKRLKGEV